MVFGGLRLNTKKHGMVFVDFNKRANEVKRAMGGLLLHSAFLGNMSHKQYYGLKSELTARIGLKGYLDLKEPHYWAMFPYFKYALYQVEKGNVGCIALNYKEISDKDKELNAIIVDKKETNLHDFIKEVNILGNVVSNSADKRLIMESGYLDNVMIILDKYMIYFVSLDDGSDDKGGKVFEYFNYMNLAILSGSRIVNS